MNQQELTKANIYILYKKQPAEDVNHWHIVSIMSVWFECSNDNVNSNNNQNKHKLYMFTM